MVEFEVLKTWKVLYETILPLLIEVYHGSFELQTDQSLLLSGHWLSQGLLEPEKVQICKLISLRFNLKLCEDVVKLEELLLEVNQIRCSHGLNDAGSSRIEINYLLLLLAEC